MINTQWLELPMSWTIFHGPKDVRAIEVRLYYETWKNVPYTMLFSKGERKRSFKIIINIIKPQDGTAERLDVNAILYSMLDKQF